MPPVSAPPVLCSPHPSGGLLGKELTPSPWGSVGLGVLWGPQGRVLGWGWELSHSRRDVRGVRVLVLLRSAL